MISADDIEAMKPTGCLIALTGVAGSGKSTIAEMLIRKGWTRVKFASTLKEMCRAMGMTEQMIEGDEKEAPQSLFGGQTPRYIMQTLGTEWGRKTIHPDLWVSITSAEIQRHLDEGRNVVVDDCRFENEASCIRTLGGVVVKVMGRGGIVGSHESESGVLPDHTIHNGGTLEELEASVDVVARQIM
jgi:hypothetical protein